MATPSPRDQVSEVSQSAQGAAQAELERRKDDAASALGSFAGALRRAARESDADGRSIGPAAEWTADGLERASMRLRGRDLRGMLREAEDFARRQPVAFFFAAAAAGFLATRFLKAGTDASGGTTGPTDDAQWRTPTRRDGEASAGADLSTTTPI